LKWTCANRPAKRVERGQRRFRSVDHQRFGLLQVAMIGERDTVGRRERNLRRRRSRGAPAPRTSSNGSGLRFCGIKLEPVEAASSSRT